MAPEGAPAFVAEDGPDVFLAVLANGPLRFVTGARTTDAACRMLLPPDRPSSYVSLDRSRSGRGVLEEALRR